MAELIKATDNLNEGRLKLNNAITDSEKALNTANVAKATADLSKAESESTQTQLDTIVIEGDSSVEAAQARVDSKGVPHTTLKSRIDNFEVSTAQQLAKTEQDLTAQLQQKADDSEVVKKGFGKLDDFDEDTRAVLLGLGPGDVNAVLGEGNVTDFNLAPKSVSASKISNKSDVSINLLNKDDLMDGTFYRADPYGSTGGLVAIGIGVNWYGTATPIPVNAGDVVRFNKAYQNGYYVGVDDTGIVRQSVVPIMDTIGYSEITVDVGVTGFYTTVFKGHEDTAMVTVNNEMPVDFLPHQTKRTIAWLDLEDKSVEIHHISDALKATIESGSGRYLDSDGVIAGDSIVAATGTNPTGAEVLLGYDGILIPKLELNSLLNIGISGRPMAEGTVNGVGTHTTVTTADINWLTKKFFICNAGTNDFKLNVPIGEIQNMRTAFDTTTYIGAYQKMIEYVLNQNPNIEIVILTPAQRTNGGYSTETTNSAGHKLIDYVNAAKSVAEKYSATLVDIYSDSGISEFKINAFTYDGLHFNNKGYEKAGSLTVKKMMYG